MFTSWLLLYTGFLFSMYFIVKYLSRFYPFDEPDARKQHTQPIPLIGGLSFVSAFIIVSYFVELIPDWMLIGSLISLILGALDDNFDIRWLLKLLVQLALVAFLAYTFWGRFTHISFYHFTLSLSQPTLVFVFAIWFVGIYNAVNLIDGIDGLAGSFMVLLCLSCAFMGSNTFSQVNLLLAILLLVFLIFNQRPAKIFMGDSGSLFLGFYVAVLPLLYQELTVPLSKTIDITPFLIIVSFLIADTTRVFFTRLLSGKNPMAADTFHFHHLVLQRSGSYLTTLFVIIFITSVSVVFAVLSRSIIFNQASMLFHLALLFLFVLTPPAPTYVNLISIIVKPAKTWYNVSWDLAPRWPRTVIVFCLLFFLLILMFFNADYRSMIPWQILLSFALLSFFLYMNRKDLLVIPTLQIFFSLLIMELFWLITLSIFVKLFIIFLLITLIIFTSQRKIGTYFNQYSALDLLIFFITISSLGLSIAGINLNFWLFLAVFVIWFSLGFILRRTLYNNLI